MQSKLITAVATQVITLADVKASLKVTDTAEDDFITSLISAVRAACQLKINRGIGAQTWQLAADSFPDAIKLPWSPVTAVDWVKYYDLDGTLTEIDAASYVLDDFSEPGYIVPAINLVWPDTYATINAVRVQFQCGYTTATLPPDLKLWMLCNIGHFHKNREAFSADEIAERTIVDGLLDGHRILACI